MQLIETSSAHQNNDQYPQHHYHFKNVEGEVGGTPQENNVCCLCQSCSCSLRNSIVESKTPPPLVSGSQAFNYNQLSLEVLEKLESQSQQSRFNVMAQSI